MQACAGDVPSLQEAQQYDFLLLGGSHYSVYEQHAWIAQLSELLRQCVAAGVKIVACCFGCQVRSRCLQPSTCLRLEATSMFKPGLAQRSISDPPTRPPCTPHIAVQLLAQALGGVVGRNPSGRFVLTVERVEPSPQLQLYPGFATAMQAAMQQAAAARAPQPALPAALGSAGGTTPGTQLGSDLQGSDRSTAGAASAPRAGGGSTSEAQSPATAAAAAPAQPAVLMPAAMPAPEPLSEALGACGPCLRLLESHGDQVISLPPGALTLASSATAAHELWALPPNVLAFQYHVEFCQSLAYQKIWSALSANGRLDVQEAAASEQALTRAPPPDSSAMVRVIQHFVRHGLGPAALGGSVEPAAGSAAGTAGHDHAAGASASASVAAAAAAAVESAGSLLARLSLRPGPAAASSSGEPAAQGLATASGTAASGASASGASASGAAASSTAASGAAASGAAAGTPEAAPLPSSRPWSPSPSETGASSPTAASERSSLATSTAVPFAYLARQRQQKDREEALRDLSWVGAGGRGAWGPCASHGVLHGVAPERCLREL